MSNVARCLTALLSSLDRYFATCTRSRISLPDEAIFYVQGGHLIVRVYRDGYVLPEYAQEIPLTVWAEMRGAKG